jgi:hypothetical protein
MNKHIQKQEVKSIIHAEDIKDAQAREKEKIRKRNAKIRQQNKKAPLTLEEKLDEKYRLAQADKKEQLAHVPIIEVDEEKVS